MDRWFFHTLDGQWQHLREQPCHGNCPFHFDQLLVADLLAFFNPIHSGLRRIEDVELRRSDEVYLDALGAERIPDPTTTGDFCRRFDQVDMHTLMETIDEVRVKVWTQQPERLMDNLLSNWAYTVMASLAWTLEAWFALILPETCRWKAKHRDEKRSVLRMQFKTFLIVFMRVPCQIERTGRRIVHKLLAWNRRQHVFLRGVDALRRRSFGTPTPHRPLRC